MSNVKFIGCLHLGHEWMARYRGFKNSQEHDEFLIKTWNEHVNKRDVVYILGDISMHDKTQYPKLNLLNGRKRVVLGNHDSPEDVPELLQYVETVAGMIDYKGYTLTHAPIHPNELSFCIGNIHAHIHHKNVLDSVTVRDRYGDVPGEILIANPYKYYMNVDAKLVNFIPQTLPNF